MKKYTEARKQVPWMVDIRILKPSHSPTYYYSPQPPLAHIMQPINKEYHAFITNTFICKRLYTLEGTYSSSRKIMM
jgi:hypothetical protein